MQAPFFKLLKNSWKQGSQQASDQASFVSGMGHRIASTSSKKPKTLAVSSAISQVVGWYSEWPHASRTSMTRHMVLLGFFGCVTSGFGVQKEASSTELAVLL
jgi:hypothetical protein